MKNLRAHIAELAKSGALDHAAIHKHAPELCRATVVGEVLAMRTGGVAITDALRDEMLAKCRAGEHVELEIEILAFEQKTGERNRNFVRFRDGAMMSIGRSGKGTPFLRDHNQDDSLSVGGKITSSATEKRDEGSYAIKQTALLTAPWLVELALRGLLHAVSIGWAPLGPVLCSACNAPVFSKCWHWKGDRLAEVDDEGGGKRMVRKADGDIIVEFIYTEAELVETSSVPVPAVAGAHIEEIRAALALEGGEEPPERNVMPKNLLAVLVTTLSLAPTAGEEEVADAVKGLARERDTLKRELSIAEAENATLSSSLEKYQANERKSDEDSFIRDALSSGRITLADESAWRDLYQLAPDRAKANLEKRKPGSATPVGQPRQANKEPEEPKAPTKNGSAVREALTAGGVNPDAAIGFAKAFGAKNPEATMADALGLNKEGV